MHASLVTCLILKLQMLDSERGDREIGLTSGFCIALLHTNMQQGDTSQALE